KRTRIHGIGEPLHSGQASWSTVTVEAGNLGRPARTGKMRNQSINLSILSESCWSLIQVLPLFSGSRTRVQDTATYIGQIQRGRKLVHALGKKDLGADVEDIVIGQLL